MGTILLKNGIVYDGLGNPGVAGDVLIKEDKIEKVGSLEGAWADQVIDVEGKVICPGFVDIHRHCDAKPLNDPAFGRRELAQGITTTVAGNCGISLTPCPEGDAGAREMYDFDEGMLVTMDLGDPDIEQDNMDIWVLVDTPPILPLCEFLKHSY